MTIGEGKPGRNTWAVMALCRASCRLRVEAIRNAHAEACEGVEGGGGGPARFYEASVRLSASVAV